ncbi:hypothetical protein C2845_PM05G19250 [Panicum miliaceum]|uniref:Uncharacterized protein n=1 Tax=Panicum miliaceum TaxID=4540 RepID=A0A3L6SXT0_PANMI|nr:hypothetical protein C2845_PM05G19250 [Panicum miliaceum]
MPPMKAAARPSPLPSGVRGGRGGPAPFGVHRRRRPRQRRRRQGASDLAYPRLDLEAARWGRGCVGGACGVGRPAADGGRCGRARDGAGGGGLRGGARHGSGAGGPCGGAQDGDGSGDPCGGARDGEGGGGGLCSLCGPPCRPVELWAALVGRHRCLLPWAMVATGDASDVLCVGTRS